MVELRSVTKRFQLQESTSLKEFLPAFLARKDWIPAPFLAVDDVSLNIAAGESVGIVGRNGSGKSTILKLIAGITEPTTGEIVTRGRICPLIELGAGFHPDLTGRENVFVSASLLGLSSAETRERYGDILRFSEVEKFMDTPVKRYSSGMYLRLAFAVAVHSEPDIMLVDETLAVGDAGFQEKCLARMNELKHAGTTIVLVSHSPELVVSFCTRALLLERGRVAVHGEPKTVVQQYLVERAMSN